MRSKAGRAGLFVAVVTVVLVVAAVAGYAMADPPEPDIDATVDNPYYTSESLLSASSLTERSGSISIEENAPRTVLIDADGSAEDLEPIVTALVTSGHEVRVRSSEATVVPPSAVAVEEGPAALEGELDEVDAMLVIGSAQFEETELDTVENFTDDGGRLIVATDETVSATPLVSTAAGPDTTIGHRFGVAVGEGYLYNMEENDANFMRVYASGGSGTLAEGVDRLVLDRASPVWSEGGTPIASATSDTRYSVTREAEPYPVAVSEENVVVVGDADLFRPLNYNRADNNVFIGNLLTFLTAGPENPYSPPIDEENRSASGPISDDAMEERPPDQPDRSGADEVGDG